MSLAIARADVRAPAEPAPQPQALVPEPAVLPSALKVVEAPRAHAVTRERNREREALERVMAVAKPRLRQPRITPAVPPRRAATEG